MPYAILRFDKKATGGVVPAQKHNEREKEVYKSNPDIDRQGTKENYHIIKPDKPYRAIIKERISEVDCRTRKDSILMVETLFTATPEFIGDFSLEEQREFFTHAVDFLRKEIGSENIFSAVVHMDEKNPHMHLCFVPITKDGHLAAKTIIGNRKKLCEWQDKYHDYMVQFYPTLERGRPAMETGRKHIPTWMLKRASALDKQGQEIADLFASINRLNAPKIKEELLDKFPAWVKQVDILSAQISSTNLAITGWKRKVREAENESYAAARERDKMRSEVQELFARVSALQKYVKYMPEEMKEQYENTRRKAIRMMTDQER